MNWVFVAFGAMLGGLGRYALNLSFVDAGWLTSTLLVNAIGSALIGGALVLIEAQSLPEQYRLLLVVGVLGSFTTFSTFSMEVIQRALTGEWLNAGLHAMASMLICLVACALGYIIARQLVN
ncbi:MAG: CrcB family protein [Luminiphilus sp.]|nr:CrcB family protein [Luminiphilus sp.]